MTTIETTTGPSPDTRPDWQIAGEAWEHAAVDWAYRFEPHSRSSVEHVFATTGVGQGVDLLDLACGSGYALGIADGRGATTSGIDASAGLIEIAARRAPRADLRIGSMFELPWSDGSFDVVTSFNGVWGGCQPAIDEAFRVLRPGGSIGLTFWGPGKAMDLRDFFITLGTTTPGVAAELMDLASIGKPGVCEAMVESSGFTVTERDATSAVLECTDDDDAWQVLRSPGAVLPSLEHVGEDPLRSLVLESVAHCRSEDGSYRIINEVTHVIAHKSI
ncbi:MAG TPA: class I SAM-dependent methyltransferase [Acidimicrobiales bacterium]|nr:class I SAM-dependent methyltransferase [Acidimicrobiales bacterium]